MLTEKTQRLGIGRGYRKHIRTPRKDGTPYDLDIPSTLPSWSLYVSSAVAALCTSFHCLPVQVPKAAYANTYSCPEGFLLVPAGSKVQPQGRLKSSCTLKLLSTGTWGVGRWISGPSAGVTEVFSLLPPVVPKEHRASVAHSHSLLMHTSLAFTSFLSHISISLQSFLGSHSKYSTCT